VLRSILAWLLCASTVFAEASAAMWIDVPFVAQPREGCGAASLSMLMQYWAGKQGKAAPTDSDVARIQHELYSPREHGIPAEAMSEYLQRHGFQAFAFPGKWSDLEEQIAKGRPLIVALRPRGQSALHYVVIDGLDSRRGLVTMNDPADRKLLNEERARFEKEWSATHNWTLLAVPAPTSH
jgi:ABC-type bacteriocin/lantibiotic exporter with double-glycine peptidase domain